MNVLFVASYPELGASSRYRVCQYLPRLAAYGVKSTFLPFVSNTFFADFYRPGRHVAKASYLARASFRRLGDLLKAARHDVVVVQREAALLGPPVFEFLARHIAGCPLVFDVDDAIFIPTHKTMQRSAHGLVARLLKDPSKAERLARWADEIVVANAFAADWAREFSSRVTVIPTVVDAEVFRPRTTARDGVPVIGWVGSHSAAPQLEAVLPALERLGRKHTFVFRAVGAGREISIPGVEVDNRPWRLEREVDDFRTLDIGLCPLFDDVWSRGKPGFKPLIYMACGVPQVSSPIGGVTEFLRPQEHGFFATTVDEWYAALDTLLSSPERRSELGRNARAAFLAGPHLDNQTPRLLDVLERAAVGCGRRASSFEAAP